MQRKRKKSLKLPALSGQLLKAQNRRSNHMAQRVDEQVGVLAAIESKLHLRQVGLQMLRADPVPSANDAALEQRERRFNGVGVNAPVNVNLCFVFDGLVAICKWGFFERCGVSVEFVG